MALIAVREAHHAFNFARKWFVLSYIGVFFITFFINAPFGRFVSTPGSLFYVPEDSIFLLDGIRSWILMESFAPITFIITFISSPLSYFSPGLPWIFSPQTLLSFLFLVHYTNRAFLSPMRTPSRSNSHVIVLIIGTVFNVVNGALMGSYLSSPFARMYLSPLNTYTRTSFWVGVALWVVGFAGNIIHDEILLNIRRRNAPAVDKGRKGRKDKKDSDVESDDDDDDVPTEKNQDTKPRVSANPNGSKATGKRTTNTKSTLNGNGEHYAIPHGLLYDYISYPNYFCEWIEWFGFALAASPLPFDFPISFSYTFKHLLLSPEVWKALFTDPAFRWAPTITPPHVFFIAEVLAMLPRAVKGHAWYKQKFGDAYPKNRKAIIPFIL